MAQIFPKDWPALYRNQVARPFDHVWQAGPVSAMPTLGGLGDCCNSAHNSTQASSLGDLGACPSTASVYVEDSSIPPWVWLIAVVWAGLMLVKKR